MSRRHRAVKGALLTGVLAALVAATGGVVVSGLAGGSGSLGASAIAAAPLDVAGSPEARDVGAPGSEDVPLLNLDLRAQDLVHLTAASRGDARIALIDGDGVTFTLVVDGVTSEITTAERTLALALAAAGVELGWDDAVSADLSAPPQPGAQVHIGRSSTQYVTEQVVTPHGTEERRTSELLVGQTRVVQEGVDGDVRVTSLVQLVDGVEVSRSTLLSTQLAATVTEVVEVGTREPVVVASGSGGSGGSGGTPTPVGSANADTSGNRALGRELMIAYGFGEDQWSCLEALWTKESQWNHLAKNRSSGAYGIPQALPGSKMASAGSDWATNPATQIQWGLGYIAGRYGTPCGAWGAFQSKGWY